MPHLDNRLVKRYGRLVKLNMNPLASLAPALKDIASTQKTSFATTQA
ncbi:transposase, partial [Acinetobacter guillouiae]